MNKLIKLAICALFLALHSHSIQAKLSIHIKKATRFDHAITGLSAVAAINGLMGGNYEQALTWGTVAAASVVGTCLDEKHLKRLVRFQAAGALVSNRIFGTKKYQVSKDLLEGFDCVNKKVDLVEKSCEAKFTKSNKDAMHALQTTIWTHHLINKKAELYGMIAGTIAYGLHKYMPASK